MQSWTETQFFTMLVQKPQAQIFLGNSCGWKFLPGLALAHYSVTKLWQWTQASLSVCYLQSRNRSQVNCQIISAKNLHVMPPPLADQPPPPPNHTLGWGNLWAADNNRAGLPFLLYRVQYSSSNHCNGLCCRYFIYSKVWKASNPSLFLVICSSAFEGFQISYSWTLHRAYFIFKVFMTFRIVLQSPENYFDYLYTLWIYL